LFLLCFCDKNKKPSRLQQEGFDIADWTGLEIGVLYKFNHR